MLNIHLSRLIAVFVLSVVGVLALSLVTGVGAVGIRPAASINYSDHAAIGRTSAPTPCSSPGSLDTSFGDDGKVTTPIGSEFDVARSVAIQPDGRIVAAGNSYNGSNSDFAVVRYNVDGTLDPSFSGDGKAVTPIFSNSDDIPFSVAIQTDGRIVVAGYTVNASNADIAVVRYNTNGTLDTSFDGDGKVTTPIGSSADIASSVAIQSDGRIVVAGFSVTGSKPDFAVVRYNSNGSFDTSFDGDGKVITSIGSTEDYARSVAIQPDGRIVVAGNSFDGPDPDFAIVRYHANGSLDTSFDDDGKVITPVGSGKSVAYSVAVQTDGRIVAAGCTNCIDEPDDNFAVVRYNTDGTLDTSFNGDGKVITSIGSNSDQAFSIAVQTDGRLVVAGFSSDGENGDFAVVRYDTNGELDPSFDGDGKVTTPISISHDQALSVAIQSDGEIVAAGSALVPGGQADFAVVRYNGAPCAVSQPAPFDYDADGRTDLSVFRPSNGAWYLQRSAEGFFGTLFGVGTDRIAPADYDGDGKTDVAVYRPSTGIWYVTNSFTGTVSYYGFGTAEDLPTPADYDGDGKADICVFRPSDGTWYLQRSSDGSFLAYQFGAASDKPTVGDFDGDGLSDFAVFRTTNGDWYQHYSSDGSFYGERFGFPTDKLAYADYDGDGKTDLAVFRPSDNIFYVRNSVAGTYSAFVFGLPEDIPTPGDYDGDGKSDISVFRPSDGNWYRLNSSTGMFSAFQFGLSGDRPTPTAYQ